MSPAASADVQSDRTGSADLESPTFSTHDLAIDRALAQLSSSVRFILDITPVDADEIRAVFLGGDLTEPEFTYRDLETSPDVFEAMLADIDVSSVEDATLGHLLRAKHREMELQFAMLRARGTDDFRQLGIELYGAVTPDLRELAESLLALVTPQVAGGDPLAPETFLAMAKEEIEHYRSIDPDIDIHAEIRSDVSGVMVSGNLLLISEESSVAPHRALALLHHEVGTHLVTQVNGTHQPITIMGTGLAGYDETQEGLAVLAEVAVGGLTPFRLRQLAARVVTVARMTAGASFGESYDALLRHGIPEGSAFTTTMRAYRSGGLAKDAIYLRGLVDLLSHIRKGGSLDLLWLGKFSLSDLPLIGDLRDRQLLQPARILPRYLEDPDSTGRLLAAAHAPDLTHLWEGTP